MDGLVKELSRICSKFPLKEKIVIVDSHTIGEQINEAFVKAGHQAINLKYKTVLDLAQSLVEVHSETPLMLLDPAVGVHFTYDLLTKLKEQDSLGYFSEMEITPSFSHAVYNTIQTLRLAGFTKDTLDKNAFISAEKAEDMLLILKEFANILDEKRLTDKAALFALAMEYTQADEGKQFILQSNLKLSKLEEQFLGSILPETVVKLPLAPVYGVTTPEGTNLRAPRWGDPTSLSYLYWQEEAVGGGNLAIFTAKTEELEVKHILEAIKIAKLPLDENIIFYSNADSYITLFYQLSQKLDLPITYGEGLPVTFSRPGRLAAGLLHWIKTNYSVQAFLDLINEGLLVLDEGAPSKTRIAKILRDLQIGWSPSRYLTGLDAEIGRLSEKIVNDQLYEGRLKELGVLRDWLSAIFKKLPPMDLMLNYKKCLAGIAYLVKNYSKTSSALDELAKKALLEEIESIVPYADETLPSYAVFEKVKDLLLGIRIGQSRPKPGHLHVTSYKQGVYNSRPNVFIVGLDNRKFPGAASEDPLLLDEERRNLSSQLPLLREKGQDNLYTLLQVMAHSTSRVTVSYCHFDINENRAVNPAFVVLQCFRLMTGNIDADFKALTALPSAIIAEDIFEDKDYWNEKLSAEQSIQIDDGVLDHFPNVKQGIAAETARNTGGLTEYDGIVQIDAAEYDPRLNPNKTMTAGKLETLAKCAYAYFLKEVLKIKPVEDFLFDYNTWLNPAVRGSLLHSIFEKFYKRLAEEGIKPSYQKHLNKLLGLARDLVEKEAAILPPPNDRIYQRELNDILACCDIFLREEERYSENYDSLQFEYSFGIGDREAAIISLPSGDIKVSGIIDRVDRANNGAYHIIDYKTGSTYNYEKNGAFKGGRQLQHLIYALAIEQHLNLGEGAVEESSYYFPTVKGLADRYTRKQDKTLRTNGIALLEKLVDVIRHGHFEMTDDKNDCKFCEFQSVCRRHLYDQDTLEMKQSNQMLKGVRAYD